MKNKTKIVLGIVVLLAIAAAVVYSKAVKPAPPDNAQLSELKFEGLMGSRYTEILVVWGNALTSNYVAGVYNTVGLNGANPAGGGDSSPAAILDKIDMKQVQADNAALSTVKNGPRLWTVDHIGVKVGTGARFPGPQGALGHVVPDPRRDPRRQGSLVPGHARPA